MTARLLHNTVRGFAGFAAVKTVLLLAPAPPAAGAPAAAAAAAPELLDVTLVTTRMPSPGGEPGQNPAGGPGEPVELAGDALRLVLDDGSALEVVELQLPGKRVMRAKDFVNGLRGRQLLRP